MSGETRRAIVLGDLKLDTIVEELPTATFPVDVAVELTRKQGADNVATDGEGRPISPPTYPLQLRSSVGMPYIRQKTIRFTNPVETAHGSNDEYEFDQFVQKLTTIRDEASSRDPSAPERLYLKSLRLCELPDEWLRESTKGVKSTAYHEGVQVPIATFEKVEKVARAVRDAHGEALSGDTTIPLTLTDVTIVHLKPYRNADTRRKYYTEGQADNQNKPQCRPKTIPQLTWNSVSEQFDELADSGLIDELEYEGYTETDEQFIEESARFVNRGDDE